MARSAASSVMASRAISSLLGFTNFFFVVCRMMQDSNTECFSPVRLCLRGFSLKTWRWQCSWSSAQWHSNVTVLRLANCCRRRNVNFCPWFLIVLFFRSISAAFKQFFCVATAELAPINLFGLKVSQQPLARTEVCHPDIVSRHRQSPSTKTRYQKRKPSFCRSMGE